jgi:phosphate transport system substrate-binding protein
VFNLQGVTVSFSRTFSTALAATVVSFSTLAADITGAGATFPFPIYAKWAEAYKEKSGIGMNYQSIGSSGGIRQIKAKTVTFGATDAPVKGAELEKQGMVQFPAIIGGTVPVFNVEGLRKGDLKITGPVLADMFLGKISKWNDPKIAELNPGKKLPDAAITVVHRADGSGTNLSSVSTDWLNTVGRGAAVKWPAPTSVGGKGNEGVAANVNRIKNSLGYVEYAYAKRNNIAVMQLMNKDGNYVMPDAETFSAAAAGADWFSVPGMGLSIVNQPGAKSYPVTTASFILMYKTPADKAQSAEVLKFFDWSFKNGKKMALELEYVPLPDSLTKQIRERVWAQIEK